MMFEIGPWAYTDHTNVKGRTEQQVRAVMKSLRLSDFGGDIEDMAKQYDTASLGIARSKVEISPGGYLAMQVSMDARIECRLKLVDYIKRHPQISQVAVRRPIFVIGFPRTGTTYLHELLGLHPEGSSHLWWEQMTPIPESHDESLEGRFEDRRKRYHGKAKTMFKMTMLTTDQAIQRIHRIEYDASEGEW
jgi:hypothetical protein